MKEVRKYGWRKDLTDHRDLIYSAPRKISLPKEVDLKPLCPKILEQKSLGACVSHSLSSTLQFSEMKSNDSDAKVTPSRLFIYWNTRSLIGQVNFDSGSSIRDGIKAVNRFGACPETMWQYDISKFKIKPPANTYKAAKSCQAIVYKRLVSIQDLQTCLASGFPFSFGVSLFDSFKSDKVAKTGIIPMPSPGERMVGGHCMTGVGFKVLKGIGNVFIVRNSWGSNWALAGYCYLPFNYMIRYGSDFWVITKTT